MTTKDCTTCAHNPGDDRPCYRACIDFNDQGRTGWEAKAFPDHEPDETGHTVASLSEMFPEIFQQKPQDHSWNEIKANPSTITGRVFHEGPNTVFQHIPIITVETRDGGRYIVARDGIPVEPELLYDVLAPETPTEAPFLGSEAFQASADLALPDADDLRGAFPLASGFLDYFPLACAYVSWISKIGNDQHNPGQPMHWARDKSTDHADKVLRHLIDRGKFDGRGVRHTGRAAWRIMAMLQTELEQELGLPQARSSIGQAPLQS